MLKPGYGRGPRDEQRCAKSSYLFYIRASMGRGEVILGYSSLSLLTITQQCALESELRRTLTYSFCSLSSSLLCSHSQG